jgi:hypothetical protein
VGVRVLILIYHSNGQGSYYIEASRYAVCVPGGQAGVLVNTVVY